MNLALADGVLANMMSIQEQLLAKPQVDVPMEHLIHGGIYVRTIRMEQGIVLMGALIKIPTMLVISGHTKVFTGDGWIELQGYHVIPAEAGRKQIFVTLGDTSVTMFFRTDATTVEQAEEEFTDEHEQLMSRKKGA